MRFTHDSRPRTVVLLQHTGIGDLIWHIHYLKMIADQSQNGQVTVVAQPSTLAHALIGKEPWVETVIDHDHRPRRGEKRKGQHAGFAGMRRMAAQLKAGRFDRIILFSGRISRGMIAWMSDIPVRMGFGYKPLQRRFLNRGPYIESYKGPSSAVYPEASAFMVAHGFCKEAVVPRMEPPAELVTQMAERLAHLPRPLYAFAIGTSEIHKQWGVANYAELARRLIEQGAGVVLLGGPAEVQLAHDIATLVPDSARSCLAALTDTPVLGSAAALRVVDVCVGNDTGMINMAAAVSTPSFVLIGSRNTLDQDPVYMHNVRADRLAEISVDQVLQLLRNAPRKSAPQP